MRTLPILLALAAGTAMAQTPAIAEILNNYGLINNGTVAQGAIFIVKGSNLADQQTDTLQNVPLQRNLRGVEIRITVSGVTTTAPLYYALNFQLAGIMPSNTPTGNGTLVVSNNGRASSPRSITVVRSAFGMLTVSGDGTGLAAVHNASYVLLSNSNATNPGQNVVFYGSGLGPVSDDETQLHNPRDLTEISITVSIGGVNAAVLYRGRTIYPGLDQINVTIPALNSYSCTVAVTITTNNVQANAGTIPVAQSGSACQTGGGNGGGGGGNTGTSLTSAEINQFVAAGSFTVGAIGTTRSTSYSNDPLSGSATVTMTDGFSAEFDRIGGADLGRYLRGEFPPSYAQYIPQVGSCIVYTGIPQDPFPLLTRTPLDAGPAVTSNGPNGTQVATRVSQSGDIDYIAANVPNTYLAQGRYTFTGTGGPDVGAFSAGMDIGQELAVTNNANELKTINRGSSVTVRWTGGHPNATITIQGQSSGSLGGTMAFFLCLASNTGQFVIPASVLGQLPASGTFTQGPITISIPGGFSVSGTNWGTRVSIPNVDYGTAIHTWTSNYTTIYQ